MPPFGLEATKDQPFFYRMHELESPFTIKLSLPEINVSAPENFALLLPRADTTRVDSFADGEQIEFFMRMFILMNLLLDLILMALLGMSQMKNL